MLFFHFSDLRNLVKCTYSMLSCYSLLNMKVIWLYYLTLISLWVAIYTFTITIINCKIFFQLQGRRTLLRLVRFPPYQIFFDQDDFFIILFRIWKWVSSSILNSKFNSEAYFSHSSTFASIWCKGQKATTFNCHFLCGWYNAITSYTNLICKSNALFIFVVCRRVSLSGEAAR